MGDITDLRQLAQEWIERGRSLVGSQVELEIYIQDQRGLTVRIFASEVEGLRYAHHYGVGIRAISEGRLGYAYSTGLEWEHVEKAVQEAAANARYSGADENNVLPEKGEYTLEDLGIYYPEAGEMPSEDKVEMALELEGLTLSSDRRISRVESAVYADAVSRVAVANTAKKEARHLSKLIADRVNGLRPLGKFLMIAAGSEENYWFQSKIDMSQMIVSLTRDEKVLKDLSARSKIDLLAYSNSHHSTLLTIYFADVASAVFESIQTSEFFLEIKGKAQTEIIFGLIFIEQSFSASYTYEP